MDNIGSSSNEDEEEKRAQINDLIGTLHTLYEVAKIPSTSRLMFLQRTFGENVSDAADEFGDVTTNKSTSIAMVLQSLADQHFCEGKYNEASLEYTQCLAHAETDSEEVGCAYANRSAALFKLGRYEKCLIDIDRALSSNYPEDKKQKLRERKDRCLSLIANKSKRAISGAAAKSSEQIEEEWRKLCDFKNPLLPSSSNKVKLECDETWGRHMIATEDIETGTANRVNTREILFCEKYFSLMVRSNYKWRHCSYCISSCEVLIPCPTCSTAMYCSESCRTRAFDSYHRIECQIFQIQEIRDDLREEEHIMALRMLLIGTDQGVCLSTLMKRLTKWDLFAEKIDPTDQPFSTDYLSVLKLCRTFDKPLLNFTSHPVLIVKIIVALQDAGYFDSDPNQPNVVQQKRLSEKELFAALLLFNHMASVKTSTSGLTQLYDYNFQERFIGSGVSVLYNMINHSCDPNVETLLRNDEMVVFAVRPISKGEQIFTVYTESFMFWPKETRAACLSNPLKGGLSFTCQCEACVNKWPTFQVLRTRRPKYLVANMKMAKRKFKKIMLPLKDNRIGMLSGDEILQLIRRLRNWLRIYIESPCLATLLCELLLRSFMKHLYDNTMPQIMKEAGVKEDVESLLSDILLYFFNENAGKTDSGEVLI